MSDNMTHTELVQAMAARPLDDQTREDAISALQREANGPFLFRLIAEDYELMTGEAGNLGGAEVWTGYFPE